MNNVSATKAMGYCPACSGPLMVVTEELQTAVFTWSCHHCGKLFLSDVRLGDSGQEEEAQR